jgi:hypothetical protein
LQILASLVVCAIVGLMLYVRLVTPGHSLGPEDKRGQAPCFWWPLALLWLAFDLAGALAGGRNYPHYFLPLAASLSVVAGITSWLLVEGIPNQAGCWGIDKALFALIVGPLIFAQVLDVRHMRSWARGSSDRPAVKSREAVATHLNTIRSSSDTLFTWDYLLPRIYFATEMKSPTRLLDAHCSSGAALAASGRRGLRRTSAPVVPPLALPRVDGGWCLPGAVEAWPGGL